MIKTFRNTANGKALKKLWVTGESAKIGAEFHERILTRLDSLDAANAPEELNLPGYDFHGLQGKPKRYSVHVNGPWCLTFEFEGGNAYQVDFEQYH